MVVKLPVEVADLIPLIRAETDDRPLENLTAASDAAEQLGILADRLVGHFLEEARAVGHSWTQIGTSLGVTRQAAQQKHVSEPRQPAPMGTDGVRNKPAPFSAVRQTAEGVEVQVEIGGVWHELVEVDRVSVGDLIATCKKHYRAHWFKRLSEDLDDVYDAMGGSLGTTADVVLADSSGRRLRRTVEVTIAKRKAAWRHNLDHRADGPA